MYSPAAPNRLRLLSANFGGAKPTCPPTAVDAKFAVGLENGQVVLIDPTNGAPAATPFQLPMQPGVKVLWNQPAYLADSQTLVIANDSQKLIRLGVGDALRPLSEVSLENKLTGPIVAAGTKVFAVEATSASDNLLQFDASSLAKGNSLPLEGRVIAGPFVVDNTVFVQTENKLTAASIENQAQWSVDFSKSMLLGAPLKSANALVFLTTNGQIWVINPASGEVIGSADAGQPLSGVAKLIPSGVLVGSDEGAVVLLPIPTSRTIE